MPRKPISVLAVLLILSAFVCFSLTPARAAPTAPTFTVNSPADIVASAPLDNGVCETAPGNGVCTLRAAIMKANHFPGGGATINFGLPGAVTYTLTIAPLGTDDELTGDLNITNTMTIIGNGAANTIIDGNNTDRLFSIGIGNKATISGVTIKNGHPTVSAGGGIKNIGLLTLINSTVTGNTVTGLSTLGGGIASEGSTGALTVTHSIINGNTAGGSTGHGGGIFADGPLTLANSTVNENTASASGGGLEVDLASATIINSTINGNMAAGNGGGILVNGTLALINSTVSGNNSNVNGGGIYNFSGTTSLFNATITGNFANADSSGSGFGGGVASGSGTVNFRNSIIGGNYNVIIVNGLPIADFEDCSGTITSQGNNIVSTTTDCTISGGGVSITDPMLGPLANNGGSTQTHALLSGSPAIDAGNVGGCTGNFGAILTTDQRGFRRPIGLHCDIGAVEVGLYVYLPFIMR